MIYTAVVTRTTATGVYVRARNLSRDTEYGPIEGLQGVALVAGDRVLIAPAEGDTVAIIRRLP